ncbi:methyltransferase domain-containing protein [Shewanella corallii]|uniref:Methyltransferase domain-containing protein n=1 Tax=Shewanella corallii TaxID=560080 RepID=A0ABT0N934_9GAMM|nr:methyltransferase domain-containing protein [Shewanella corallii]MCL2914371.1 methyltransferase domain-containing protein [Shewanella corallii]
MRVVNQTDNQIVSGNHSQEVAHRFSMAANSYDRHNLLQRETASRLLTSLSECHTLLDIGAGPGTDLPLATNVLAVDIAPGMLRRLRQHYPNYQTLCADAQNLPLAEQCCDSVYSNLALQWCPDLSAALAEIHRVLKPGAECHVSLVVDGSLPQLSQLGLRCNAFPSAAEVQAVLRALPWQQLSVETSQYNFHFDSLKPLLMSVKGVGASARFSNKDELIETDREKSHSVADNLKPAGLKGKAYWQTLVNAAEALRESGGIPLSYQILFIHARK